MREEPPRGYDSLPNLLPSNSSALERDVLRVVPFDSILMPLSEVVKEIGEAWETPDEFLPWVVRERGLSALSEFLPDRYIFGNAWDIARYKGTVWAGKWAARSTGFSFAEIDERDGGTIHFAEFGFFLGSLFTARELYVLYHLAEELKPLRSRFRRVTYNWDEEMLSWSGSPEGLFSSRSGVWLPSLPYRADFSPAGQPSLWVSIARDYQSTGVIGNDDVAHGDCQHTPENVYGDIYDDTCLGIWSGGGPFSLGGCPSFIGSHEHITETFGDSYEGPFGGYYSSPEGAIYEAPH